MGFIVVTVDTKLMGKIPEEGLTFTSIVFLIQRKCYFVQILSRCDLKNIL